MSTRGPVAITREISDAISACELTHVPRTAIDVSLAREQHAGYERALSQLGCTVRRLPATPEMPDSVFVEDTAVVLSEVALLTRPGAESRRVELARVEQILREYRTVVPIEAPGTMDGGDILVVGRTIFAGRSSRTNDHAIRQLATLAAEHRYAVHPVDVRGCLHLKSAVTQVADDLLLVNRAWVPADVFSGFDTVDVHPREPYAANALRIENALVYPDSFPRTCDRLKRRGLTVHLVNVSELQKAEGAVTCCSVLVQS